MITNIGPGELLLFQIHCQFPASFFSTKASNGTLRTCTKSVGREETGRDSRDQWTDLPGKSTGQHGIYLAPNAMVNQAVSLPSSNLMIGRNGINRPFGDGVYLPAIYRDIEDGWFWGLTHYRIIRIDIMYHVSLVSSI